MKEQALDIIRKSRLMYLATIDEDGTPRSTILLVNLHEDGQSILWRSSPDSVHSRNIYRSSVVGISAYYEDMEKNVFRAVYVATTAQDAGNKKVYEEDGSVTRDYIANIGEYDESQSIPDRLYFRESQL